MVVAVEPSLGNELGTCHVRLIWRWLEWDLPQKHVIILVGTSRSWLESRTIYSSYCYDHGLMTFLAYVAPWVAHAVLPTSSHLWLRIACPQHHHIPLLYHHHLLISPLVENTYCSFTTSRMFIPPCNMFLPKGDVVKYLYHLCLSHGGTTICHHCLTRSETRQRLRCNSPESRSQRVVADARPDGIADPGSRWRGCHTLDLIRSIIWSHEFHGW